MRRIRIRLYTNLIFQFSQFIPEIVDDSSSHEAVEDMLERAASADPVIFTERFPSFGRGFDNLEIFSVKETFLLHRAFDSDRFARQSLGNKKCFPVSPADPAAV